MRNLLVAQSGGPTAAINATVAGVVSCAVLSGKVDHIYGAVNGCLLYTSPSPRDS